MRTIVAVSALALLAGCAVSPPPGYPRLSYRPPPGVYYAYPYRTYFAPPPAPWRYPASYPVPRPSASPAPPPATAAAPPAPGSQTDPYNPYTKEQMATGIAEAAALAALLSMGESSPSRGASAGFPDMRLRGPSPYRTNPPEPYSCSWGYATMGTCVGPR